jgi:hypothetical protein
MLHARTVVLRCERALRASLEGRRPSSFEARKSAHLRMTVRAAGLLRGRFPPDGEK